MSRTVFQVCRKSRRKCSFPRFRQPFPHSGTCFGFEFCLNAGTNFTVKSYLKQNYLLECCFPKSITHFQSQLAPLHNQYLADNQTQLVLVSSQQSGTACTGRPARGGLLRAPPVSPESRCPSLRTWFSGARCRPS
ncbi:Hypothetical_protein [Hexamita inflata]|uniref:Hypothetical_protein n=1 Tax=Hexamita inflata TaxID=28002 RepID=A0AA86V0G4_9EUKA|nr:Hypothetical protein HINF_LOCUS63299 [Hexamita inflata]